MLKYRSIGVDYGFIEVVKYRNVEFYVEVSILVPAGELIVSAKGSMNGTYSGCIS